MRVLVVHYHLKPGGVTTVIRGQLAALASRGVGAALLVGEAPPDDRWGGTPPAVDRALAYDGPGSDGRPDAAKSAAIAAAIRREAARLASGGDDVVVHVHNPTIRKNASLLPALSALAGSGVALVMHVHDLAEDWRPEVYSDRPYPDGAAWAAINRRDAEALAASGAGSAFFLPNPLPRATGAEPPTRPSAGAGLVLYPVRGIRRKNLGEAVLLSLFMRPGGRVGVTLPPNSQRDRPYYDGWKAAAFELGAPIAFELGLGRGLDELYREAKAAVTTSVKEGFGLSYLEPAIRGRATLGRRLAKVVDDFEAEGLSFPALYGSIAAPRGLFDGGAFARRAAASVREAVRAYGVASESLPEAVAADLAKGDAIDFGRLDEAAQLEVLRAVRLSPEARRAVASANPFIDGWDEAAERGSPLAAGALEPWSEERYADRLEELYEDAIAGGGAAPDKAALLGLYLRPEAFHGVGV
ncbi:MAG TPA: hypothetical protein P5298_03855 [Spirochaetia bacterium]|nr:hypothetical protein [Spirochaetia bacterium]